MIATNKNTKNAASNGWQRAGSVAVDSGQMMLCDPCYIKSDFESDVDAKPGMNYAGACKTTLSGRGFGNFGPGKFREAAFVCGSGYGDGVYPVEVRVENGRVVELRVRFTDDA